MDNFNKKATQQINQANALVTLLCHEQAFTSDDTAMVENTLWMVSDILVNLANQINNEKTPSF
ncbi:hypothetical protein A8139_05625 [Marinomonas primoryensis]|uniref:Uncharacterized protein n=1 Tax=Marinomonas primoryensis TaxID=178399 RepID=A0A2Z4PPH5_9GAMM|nr:hypothetical protein [Marinomonas primoryensis]AWX99530.1 hypothetical protein A8139_05625 [Marinomonas primoryensis]